MSSEKRYEPQMSLDYTKWFTDWREFAETSTKKDGPESVAISDYLFNTVGVDRRNIATGGASDYEFVIHYPRPHLADSYGQSQWMAILLIQMIMDIAPKRRVLALSGGLDRFRLKPFQEIFSSEIYFLNNKKLAMYEKFQYENTPLEYSAVTQQYLENNSDFIFDMIIGWSQDMENPFIPVDFYVDRLSPGGVLVIQNSSDSLFLYHNDTKASPVWEYHDRLKQREDCRVYHVPIFYGVTIVVKDTPSASASEWPEDTYDTAYLIDVDTPFGKEQYTLGFSPDGTGEISFGESRQKLSNYAFSNGKLSADIDVDVPMTTKVQLELSIDSETNQILGSAKFGEFMECAITGKQIK